MAIYRLEMVWRVVSVVLSLVVSSCTRPNPSVCCVSEDQCAAFGEPPNSRPCNAGYACVDRTCVVADAAMTSDAALDDSTTIDAAADAVPDAGPVPRCLATSPFGPPALVSALNSSLDEDSLRLNPDETIAYLSRFDGAATPTILRATRSDHASPFSAPGSEPAFATMLGAAGDEYMPSLTGDGLVAYFHRQINNGPPTIHVAARQATAATFSSGTPVTANGSNITNALFPLVSRDGQRLYWLDFSDFRLRMATRTGGPGVFGGATPVSTVSLYNVVLAANELTIYYSLNDADVLVSTRSSVSQSFGAGSLVPNVNSGVADTPLFVTDDGCQLYLKSRRPGGLGGFDVWVSSRSP